MEYKFEYDPNGFPRILEEYALSKEPPKKELHGFTVERKDGKLTQTLNYKETGQDRLILTRRWVWENDAEGRIRHMVAPCDRELKLDFARATTEAGDEILSIVTDLKSGAYRYLRFTEKGDTWVSDRGHGAKDMPLTQATPEARIVQKRIGHEQKTTEIHAPTSGSVIKIDYDASGRETTRTHYSRDGDVVAKTGAASANPGSNPWKHDSHGLSDEYRTCDRRITYGYDSRGFLAWAREHDKDHRFGCDVLGRLVRRESPVSGVHAFLFNASNLVESYSRWDAVPAETSAGAAEPPSDDTARKPSFSCTYRYNPLGQLVRSESPDTCPRVYRYACEGIESYREVGYRLLSYKYGANDRLRRVVQTPDPTRKRVLYRPRIEEYKYTSEGVLDGYRTSENGTDWTTVHYAYDEEGNRRVRRIEGPVTDDDLNRVSRTSVARSELGTRTVSYNLYGAVIDRASSPSTARDGGSLPNTTSLSASDNSTKGPDKP